MIAIAALLATASSVNAMLYASAGMTTQLAAAGQFPPFFGSGSRLGANSGLIITGMLVLVVANVVDLSAIASVGSACSLIIFLLVGIAGHRLRAETGAQAIVVIAAIAVTAIVLGFFAVDTLRNEPATFAAIVAIALRDRPRLALEAKPPRAHARDPYGDRRRGGRATGRRLSTASDPRPRRRMSGSAARL
jgi:L-asparagine transporter-like permease